MQYVILYCEEVGHFIARVENDKLSIEDGTYASRKEAEDMVDRFVACDIETDERAETKIKREALV